LSQQIGLAVGEIVAVETRRLSGTRTALASALVVGAAALALRVILGEAIHRSRPDPTYPQDTWLLVPGYGGGR
jgi:hypothetical protein